MLLERSGIHVSMSRKGNCWDNAVMKSFFGTVKGECVGSTLYSSHDEARFALFAYMEVYYNRVRRHSTLGYVSPFKYEQKGSRASACRHFREEMLLLRSRRSLAESGEYSFFEGSWILSPFSHLPLKKREKYLLSLSWRVLFFLASSDFISFF
jgi:Integrase core domain